MESAAKINENMVRGLRLNDLPDELILKIFSMLPNFKESVATHLISKQHEDPYKLVRDVTLEYENEGSFVNFMSFVYGSSLSGDDQILQRLHLKLVRNYSASDINFWVQVAVSRSVRKLRIDLYGGTLVLPSCLSSCTTLKSLILRDVRIEVGPLVFSLPSLKSLHLFSVDFLHTESIASLLRGCPDLEYLVLNKTSYEFRDVKVCLSSLKSLHLLSAKHHYGGSLTRLLQSCQVLEYLVVNQTDNFWNYWDIPPASCLSSIKSLHLSSARIWSDESIATLFKSCVALEDLVISRTRHDNVMLYNISVPTLKSLTINNSIVERVVDDKENHGFWINAPALETLNIKDTVSNFIMLEFMPKVTKANIQVTCAQPERFIGSLTSIQHLSLCCPTSDARKLRWPSNVKNVSSMFGYYKYILHLLTPYRIGSVFPYLEHLELCTCSLGWANLLAFILNDAPRLQSLKLKSNHSSPNNDPNIFWETPAVVPECLLMHLEIFEWIQYGNTVHHRKVAAYILANATCLKMATFSTRSRNKDHRMVVKLKKLKRISKTCQLVFE